MSEIIKVRCDWCSKSAEVIQHQAQQGNPPTWEYPDGWRAFQEGGFSNTNRIHACPKCDPIAKRERVKEKEKKRAEREARKTEREARKTEKAKRGKKR